MSVIAPAAGGLLVGPLTYFLAREAKGHGVPEVMEAVALRGGRIRPIVAVVKSVASALCIGTGGSVGREGPIVQIGSTFGSTLGQSHYDGHLPSPGGCDHPSTTATLTEDPGSDHDLDVPSDGAFEGSYGADATEVRRPAGTSVCHVQDRASCALPRAGSTR